MNVALTIDEPGFIQSVKQCFEKAIPPCETAMAQQFAEVAYENFDRDIDRPIKWEKLKRGYAYLVHGGDRTPRLQLSGDLRDSILNGVTASTGDGATVSTNIPYGALHQEGFVSYFEGEEYDIPARPFMPIDGGEVTSKTADLCVSACEQELAERLR